VEYVGYMVIHGMIRVGQNHIYTVYIWCFWQGNHQIYGVYIRFWPTLGMMGIWDIMWNMWDTWLYMAWLGLAITIYIYGVYTVLLSGKSPDIR